MALDRKRPAEHVEERRGWVRWRAGRLMRAGFSPELADQLAVESRIDLHELLGLLDRGCPPDLAARILAPLEDEAELS
jgi:hypothetical protein